MNKNSLKSILYLLLASNLCSTAFSVKAADEITLQNQTTKTYDTEAVSYTHLTLPTILRV